MRDIVQRVRSTLSGTKSLLSLSIEGMSLKLLACRGQRVSAWAIIPLNPRFLRGGFLVPSPQLTGVIKAAVSKKEFSRQRRVLACLPSFHSVSRLLELPSSLEARPEVIIPQQAKRDMGYSAENNLLLWQPVASEGGQQRFFIISVPKEPVITLIETLKMVGLHPDKIETTTFALCRAVNQSQAIIFAVEPNSLHSIIMRDTIPLTSQSTFWGEAPRDMESLPSLVTPPIVMF